MTDVGVAEPVVGRPMELDRRPRRWEVLRPCRLCGAWCPLPRAKNDAPLECTTCAHRKR